MIIQLPRKAGVGENGKNRRRPFVCAFPTEDEGDGRGALRLFSQRPTAALPDSDAQGREPARARREGPRGRNPARQGSAPNMVMRLW